MIEDITPLLGKIHQGDCIDFMKQLPDKCVDLVVTSPPYDNLRAYNGFVFDFEGIAKELFRITKDGGVVVWVVADATINGSETLTSAKQKIFFREVCGFNIHDTMIYERQCRFPDANRYQSSFEYKFILSRGTPKTINLIADKKNNLANCFSKGSTGRNPDGTMFKSWIAKTGGKIKEFGVRSNIWRYNTGFNKTTKDKYAFEHPAMFPEQLANDHIISWSNPGDIVFDPFMGSGTTAKMAIRNGRKFIGTEISNKYVDIANKRIEAERNQLKLF